MMSLLCVLVSVSLSGRGRGGRARAVGVVLARLDRSISATWLHCPALILCLHTPLVVCNDDLRN